MLATAISVNIPGVLIFVPYSITGNTQLTTVHYMYLPRVVTWGANRIHWEQYSVFLHYLPPLSLHYLPPLFLHYLPPLSLHYLPPLSLHYLPPLFLHYLPPLSLHYLPPLFLHYLPPLFLHYLPPLFLHYLASILAIQCTPTLFASKSI